MKLPRLVGWDVEYGCVAGHFATLGKQRQREMYHAWRDGLFPESSWNALGAEGFFSEIQRRPLPQALSWYAAAIEGFSYGSQNGGFAIALVTHTLMAWRTIQNYGSAELLDRYEDGVTSGRFRLGFGVTEREAGGTDCFNPRTVISRSMDGQFRLNGGKSHITNVPHAHGVVVLARDGHDGALVAVLVETNWEGVMVGRSLNPIGARTSPVASIRFDEVRVPECNVIRFPDGGRAALEGILVAERALVPFAILGLLEAALDKCVEYALAREVFGNPIVKYQHVQARLTDMRMSIDGIRVRAADVLNKMERGEDVKTPTSSLKITSTKAGIAVIDHAIKLCATTGFQEQAQFQMMLMDLYSVTIGGGTEEAHRTVILQQMLRRRGKGRTPMWLPGEPPPDFTP